MFKQALEKVESLFPYNISKFIGLLWYISSSMVLNSHITEAFNRQKQGFEKV